MHARIGMGWLFAALWALGWLASEWPGPGEQAAASPQHWRRTAAGWERVEPTPLPPFQPLLRPTLWALFELCTTIWALQCLTTPRRAAASGARTSSPAVNRPNHQSNSSGPAVRVPEDSLQPA